MLILLCVNSHALTPVVQLHARQIEVAGLVVVIGSVVVAAVCFFTVIRLEMTSRSARPVGILAPSLAPILSWRTIHVSVTTWVRACVLRARVVARDEGEVLHALHVLVQFGSALLSCGVLVLLTLTVLSQCTLLTAEAGLFALATGLLCVSLSMALATVRVLS